MHFPSIRYTASESIIAFGIQFYTLPATFTDMTVRFMMDQFGTDWKGAKDRWNSSLHEARKATKDFWRVRFLFSTHSSHPSIYLGTFFIFPPLRHNSRNCSIF